MDSNPFNYNDQDQFECARQDLVDRIQALQSEVEQYLDASRYEGDNLDRLREGLGKAADGAENLDESAVIDTDSHIDEFTVQSSLYTATEKYNGLINPIMYYARTRFCDPQGEVFTMGFFLTSIYDNTDWNGYDQLKRDLLDLDEFPDESEMAIFEMHFKKIGFCSNK